MRCALRTGLLAGVLGILMVGCQLGDRVEKPNLDPNTFIEEGYPEENQTWLADAVTFRFFGADADNEVVAFMTMLEPAVIREDSSGVPIDTLWSDHPEWRNLIPAEIETTSYYEWERTELRNRGYQGLKDAYYRFSVRAIDEADGLDPWPATRRFLILASTWPEIVVDRCPPRKDASPREYMEFHGELGTLLPHEFLYSWMLAGGVEGDELTHTWTPFETGRGVTQVSYAGLQPGATYFFRVKCAIERAGVVIQSQGFAECEFTIRQN